VAEREWREWRSWAEAEMAGIRTAGRYRSPRAFDGLGPVGTLGDGTKVVSFAGNDYLGLSEHPALREAAHEALERWGTGATAARLVVGSRPVHDELEAELAAWKGAEAAVLFGTGFQANLGVVTTFGGPGTLVVSDELNHASIIDGARLARAEVAVVRHVDVQAVEHRLAGHDGPAVVVTDSVFSMDGDLAPVDDLAEVCGRHGALLVLDEAHAVLGPEAPSGAELVRVGTLSKALASVGGFAVADRPLAELLVNRARSYIFTTATPPADSAAALAAVRVVRSAEGDVRRAALRANVERLRPGHPSPIIPVLVGDEGRALAVSDELLRRGLLVPAIRPPTVAPGTCRLRVAVSAAHTDEQLDELADALGVLVPAWRGE
jgi:8-amino-7-oxononanoate synthase